MMNFLKFFRCVISLLCHIIIIIIIIGMDIV